MSRVKQQTPTTPPCPAISMDFDWRSTHALVIGLGESGLATVKWLLRQGAAVTIIDSRETPPAADAVRALSQDGARLAVHVGVATPLAADWLAGVQMVIPSPGLTPHTEYNSPIATLLQAALEQRLPIYGEIDLFEWAIHHAAHASSLTSAGSDLELPLELPKVLAITGTNGKTTTTQMTTALLRRAGFDAQEAGNISPSLLDAVMAREDQSRFPQVWVLELSSFQLAIAKHFHPTAAALLNITEDHLDWHLDMQDYIDAKARVFGHGLSTDAAPVCAIVNRQDAAVMKAAAGQPQKVSFGLDQPVASGDLGLIEEGIVWMAVRDSLDESRLHRLMPADALRVRGRHNAMNALAALALCRAVTPALAPLLHALREFRGGAHRTEWVRHIHGVDFVDDSKGTNVGATVAALTGIGTPLVLIAGGDGKGQDFSPMAEAIRRFAKAVVTIGRDGPTIAQIAVAQGVTVLAAESMEDAVRQAYTTATQLGGIPVLMSPACASFDMFKNYVARAQAFRDAVMLIGEEQGVAC
jgi:UDP-N-acetylmuramoylalanine--D-glutamate ligase